MEEETFLTNDEWNNSYLFVSRGGFSRLRYFYNKYSPIFLYKTYGIRGVLDLYLYTNGRKVQLDGYKDELLVVDRASTEELSTYEDCTLIDKITYNTGDKDLVEFTTMKVRPNSSAELGGSLILDKFIVFENKDGVKYVLQNIGLDISKDILDKLELFIGPLLTEKAVEEMDWCTKSVSEGYYEYHIDELQETLIKLNIIGDIKLKTEFARDFHKPSYQTVGFIKHDWNSILDERLNQLQHNK